MAHFVHYIKRELVVLGNYSRANPWFAEHQPDDQGFAAPTYHVTRSNPQTADRVAEGDTLWLCSQLSTPRGWGGFPPALDAKIVVSKVKRRRPVRRFLAGLGSRWFPLFDARKVLLELTTIDNARRERPLLSAADQPLGATLQGLRQLLHPQLLLDLEQKVAAVPLHFVSHRLLDGTHLACDKTLELVRDGKAAVWWDRWSLPRRLAEPREFVSHPVLDGCIKQSLRASSVVWAINSPQYRERGSYSWQEFHEASSLGTLRWWPKAPRLP